METATAHLSRRCRPIIASAVIASALLASVATRIPAASGTTSVGAAFAQTRTVAHRHAVRPAYGWPVKPFSRQHPVRANLNDPRNGHGDAKSFHFGIDITAPVGAPVYAVEGGKVFLTRGRMAVAVTGAASTFGYWHVRPAVRNHQIVQLHQLLGHIVDEGGGAHVHFAERDRRNGRYLNPLRPGGIGPYVDRTPPRVAAVEFLRSGREVDAKALSGRVDVVAEIADAPPMLVPAPWSRLPVTASRIRWSLTHGSRQVLAPRTVINSDHMLPGTMYDKIFAPGTSQNWVGQPGHYRYYLARGLHASRLPAGVSHLRIEAVDTRGNRTVAQVEIAPA
ncbi:MAG TPA: M23 family metallopeptidase [Gaiellaceae bacterium]|jgi:Peptidase family M23